MTSGMRRPPRLWEQKLEGMIRSAGVSGIGGASSSVISPGPVPGPDTGGSEPAPPPVVDPDPSTPRIPSTPVVAGTTLGLTIIWDGKDTGGILFPKGTTVEVHVSASTGFTPSSGTLKGIIAEAGGSLLVGGISAGATFYVRLVAVYADGQKSDPSAEGSAMVGLVQGPEINGDAVITQIVSATTPVTTFKLGSIWINTSNGTYNVLQDVGGTPTWVKREWDTAAIAANAITANQIAAQAITAKLVSGEVIRTTTVDSGARVRITSADGVEVYGPSGRVFQASPAGTVTITGYATSGDISNFITGAEVNGNVTSISGGAITTGTVSADRIDVANLTARNFQTAASGARVQIGNLFGALQTIQFYSTGGAAGFVGAGFGTTDLQIAPGSGSSILLNGPTQVSGAFSASGTNIDFPGAAANIGAVTYDAGFNGNRLRAKTSTQRVKYDISTVDGLLSDVDEARQSDVVTVDPHAILDVGVAEFSWVEEGEPTEWRELGFIADDVAAKFPIAASVSPEGEPLAVRETAMIAALLVVVRDQRSMIEELRDRVGALEG